MKFLSHPEIELQDHLQCVAKRAQQILDATSFQSGSIAFYAGLFHDLGKINPYYQRLFEQDSKQEAAKYDDFHSIYSCWIAKKILRKNKIFQYNDISKILILIYHHHTALKNTGTYAGNDIEKSRHTKDMIIQNWAQLKSALYNTPGFKGLDLDIEMCIDENIKMTKPLESKSQDHTAEYVEFNFLFSALLAADKGSFGQHEQKKYGLGRIDIVTNCTKSELNPLRDLFQKIAADKITGEKPITVINAPTGIGKTRVFLDAITKYDPSRVFYFSPLLALTNDFESKLKKTDIDASRILTYNHVYSGTLQDKENPDQDNNTWNFDQESFNEEFVITTMQRLLMTIFSNKNRDKLKLASFADALLIVDEVQMLPKVLLKSLCDIFKIMAQMMGTRVLLVSATIPHELHQLPKIALPDSDYKRYLEKINHKITKQEGLPVPSGFNGRNMIMVNTRRTARDIYNQTQDTAYITSGIKKSQQDKIIKRVKNMDDITLVSTQVLEAGVDISFSRIWRQMAPLDNIVQVLGRLDREGKDSTAVLTVFDLDGHNIPYESLEYNTAKKYLADITDTISLYQRLPAYYKEINEKNNTQKDNEVTLDIHIKNFEFKKIWEDVRHYMGEEHHDTIYIPDIESWDEIRSDLLNSKNAMKKHAGIVASLPVPIRKVMDMLDETLLEKNIYLPKKECVDELYDKNIGLDKWIQN